MSSGEDSDRLSASPGAPSGSLPGDLVGWPGFALAWAADEAARFYAGALAPLGIKPQHLGILTLLGAEGPMVQARIGDRLAIVKPAVVGLLNEMEAKGLVERRPHPTDKRAFEVHVLEEGRGRVREAEVVSREATEEFFAGLSADERRTLQDLLARLAASGARRRAGGTPDDTEEERR